ncbi:MAG TPA: hypothetical protein VFU88_02880 [Ktedonobacterales bacterium]|nr:hypothetical protein [Ktedonobacterales bacterium]
MPVEVVARTRTQALTASERCARRLRTLRRSPWVVAALVAVVYCLWTAGYLLAGHSVLDVAHVGRRFALQSHASSDIVFPPDFAFAPSAGYDGQFNYFIALDPAHAAAYIDRPSYRYTRILYPLLARAAALGQPALVPYSLLLVNALAVAGGVLVVGLWLRRKGRSPWWALLYGFSAGLFIAYQFDLAEPLAYGLAALGVYLLDFGGRRRVLWAGLAFALAALARETTLVFPLIYAALAAVPGAQRRAESAWSALRRAATLVALTCGPLLAYKLFLARWLGGSGLSSDLLPTAYPLKGLVISTARGVDWWQQLASVVLPAVMVGAAAAWALLRSTRARREAGPWLVLAHVTLFVLFLGPLSYANLTASARVSVGVALAAIYCLPALGATSAAMPDVEAGQAGQAGRRRGWRAWTQAAVLLAGLLWLIPTAEAVLTFGSR